MRDGVMLVNMSNGFHRFSVRQYADIEHSFINTYSVFIIEASV